MNHDYPSYLALYRSGELERRVVRSLALLGPLCRVCPRGCRVDRSKEEVGECGVGRRALLSSYGPHFGEEPALRGRRGSGTVFFAGCNLHCVYCQNYDISQLRHGQAVSPDELARVFMKVQALGCHNLNLVTPSHVVPQILEALLIAVGMGFRLPLVYNTSSYDSLHCLRLLDGVVDIYMPDLKCADSALALRYSSVKAYWQVATRMIREMQRQTDVFAIGRDGLARRGLLIRHLVLPEGIAGSERALEFIARELSPHSYVNLMDQYRPTYLAGQYPELCRFPDPGHYHELVEYARSLGIHRGIPFG